jgi:hypothetical protein
MHEPRIAFGPDPLDQPPDLACRQPQDLASLPLPQALIIACRITCTRFNSCTLICTVSSLTMLPSQ